MPTLEAVKAKLAGFVNSRDHTAEVNLLGYAFGLVTVAVLLLIWTVKGNRDGNLAIAIGTFCAAFTGGLFKKGSTCANGTTTPQGTKGPEGEA